MKIATWNVNSLNVRLEHVLQWLEENPVDMIGLQETKTIDENFPIDAFSEKNLNVAFAGQKTYNGVAIVSPHAIEDVVSKLPGDDSGQQRFIAATINGVRLINCYVPNGQSLESDKYLYKLDWLTHLTNLVNSERQAHTNLAMVGDFNIVPRPEDSWDPEKWEGDIFCSPPEREALNAATETLTDSWLQFEEHAMPFTWWDYRAAAFRRKMGLRIDHIYCSDSLASRLTYCDVDVIPRKWERPSDHAPVVAEFR